MTLNEAVEKLNTVGIKRADFMKLYGRFCEIEPSKAAQKQLDSRYEKTGAYQSSRASGIQIRTAFRAV